VPAGETWRFPLSGFTPVRPVRHTGQTGHQTGQPTSKLTQTRNSPNTGQQRTHQDIHPSKNPPRVAPVRPVRSTGQTGVAWAARDEQHLWVNSPKSKLQSPESLHGLEPDFGDIRNTSLGVHSHDFVHQNLSKKKESRKSRQEHFQPKNSRNPKIEPLYSRIWEGNHSPKNHEGFPQISPIKSRRERSRKQPKEITERGLRKSPPRTTGENTSKP
jgi:hypothetical protein